MEIFAAVLLGVIVTVCFQFVVNLLPSGTTQVTMPTSLPARIQTLADMGRLKIRFVRTKAPLPQRLPGAALVSNPPDPFPQVHVSPLPCKLMIKLAGYPRLLRWALRLDTEIREWVLGSPQIFANDWAKSWNRDIVEYQPRHADRDPRWFTYPTAWWPSLATTVDWYEMMQYSLLNRCSSEPATYVLGTITWHNCRREPPVYGIEGVYDADYSGGPGPRGQVDPRVAADDAAVIPVRRRRNGDAPQRADDASTGRVRHAAAGV